jgi:thiol:disulfide interchange protein DsbD
MNNRLIYLYNIIAVGIFAVAMPAAAQTVLTQYEDQSSSARVEPARMNDQPGIAVVFEGTSDLHYYAKPETAPAPGLELTVTLSASGLSFGPTVYPTWGYFNDPAQGKTEVYVGNFKVFVPLTTTPLPTGIIGVTAEIKGIACTSKLCLAPFTKQITAQIDFSQAQSWPTITFETAPPRKAAAPPPVQPTPQAASDGSPDAQALIKTLSGWQEQTSGTAIGIAGHPAWYLLLALLAGLSINIMPCVLPIIPLIIMRLISQAKESPARRVSLGFSFCGGIVLFFAAFAVLSAVVKLATGAALDLNSIYRSPAAAITLFILLVLFALVLLDAITLTVPASVASRQGSRAGAAGSVSMGFFAGILSTPCSGAIIGAVLVWAQTQPLAVSGAALVLMGVGMALPYAVLVSIPKLLDFVPKPGTWMEIFKKTGGFLLLLVAFKFTLATLAKDHLLNVLIYGVIFAFCVWMWGSWVGLTTPKSKKWTTRLIAVVIAVAAGFWLLPSIQAPKIDWQPYDAAVVQKAIEDNRPLVLKFTADWCTNCKIVDKNVYQQPDIAKLIRDKDFIAVKADTTQAAFPAAVDMKRIFGEPGNVPVTILLNPETKTLIKLRGIFTPDEFKQLVNEQF